MAAKHEKAEVDIHHLMLAILENYGLLVRIEKADKALIRAIKEQWPEKLNLRRDRVLKAYYDALNGEE